MELHRHPDSPRSPVRSIEALATHLPDGRLSLVFSVIGDVDQLCIPQAEEPVRVDGLWKHTCFEAFVRLPDGQSYHEFNLSPSGSWAAYRFEAYRTGMSDVDVPAPIIRSAAVDSQFGLVAAIDLGDVRGLPPSGYWQVGMSAVMEARDGSKSYWALAHPEGPPDFHHDTCFAASLPPIGA